MDNHQTNCNDTTLIEEQLFTSPTGDDYKRLLNVFTVMYNRDNKSNVNMIGGITAHDPADTTRIQEKFYSMYSSLPGKNEDDLTIYEYTDDNADSIGDLNECYMLTIDGDKFVSKSELSLYVYISKNYHDKEMFENAYITKL